MDKYSKRIWIITALLSTVALIIASVAVAQIKKLYLPLPLSLAILNIIIPVAAFSVALISEKVHRTSLTPLFAALTFAASYVPFTLLVLSFIYGSSSDLLSCAAERRWLHFFQTHEQAIRVIQDSLQCCGFNSLRDRAYPFPHGDVSARACEETLGYTIRCADVWIRQETHAARMAGFASLLNWVVIVLLLASRRGGISFQNLGITNPQQGLIEAAEQHNRIVTEEQYEDEPRRQQ